MLLLFALLLWQRNNPPDYSQEPFVIEQKLRKVRFDNNGTSTRDLTMRIRIQSEAGVRTWGSIPLAYRSGSEELQIRALQVDHGGSNIVNVGPEAIRDVSPWVLLQAPTYTDYRQKVVTVPGLRPGVALEVSVRVETKKPLVDGHFWYEDSFERNTISLNEVIEVDLPSSRLVKVKTIAGVEPEVTEAGERRLYVWKRANLQRQVKSGAEYPPLWIRAPNPDVQLTTFQSWQEVGDWYAGVVDGQRTVTPEIRSKALALTGSRNNDVAKVEAIYDFVAKSFRYVSVSLGQGFYRSHSAAEVITNGYGDCKDKHTLLASLLSAVGLRAEPVLISSVRDLDPDIPSPAQFDHVVSAVKVGNEYIWLDTSVEVGPFRMLSAPLRARKALLVESRESRIIETPSALPFPNHSSTVVEATLDASGNLGAHVRVMVRGDDETFPRSVYRGNSPEQWRHFVQQGFNALGIRAEVSNVAPSDPTATREAFTVDYDFRVEGYAYLTGGQARIDLPLAAALLTARRLEGVAAREARVLFPYEVNWQLNLRVPPGYKAHLPKDETIARDHVSYWASYRLDGQVLTANRIIRFVKHDSAVPADKTFWANVLQTQAGVVLEKLSARQPRSRK